MHVCQVIDPRFHKFLSRLSSADSFSSFDEMVKLHSLTLDGCLEVGGRSLIKDIFLVYSLIVYKNKIMMSILG